MAGKVFVGTIVGGKKSTKTRRVEISRLSAHARYGKTIRSRTVCYAHDEADETSFGDIVEIVESRPMSRLKRWRLVGIIKKA